MICKVTAGPTSQEATVWMAQNNHLYASKEFLSGHESAEVLRDWARKNGRHSGWCHIANKDDGSTAISLPGAITLTGCVIAHEILTEEQAIEQGFFPPKEANV